MKKVLLLFVVLFLPLFAFAAFTQDLYFGLTNNPLVSELQRFLVSEKVYSGPVTGNFFSLTLQGVKNFQLREGITPVAGYFGPKTRARANELLSKQGTAKESASTSEITITIQPHNINLQSIVGIYCVFENSSGDEEEVRGSGVIVHPEGYVLTSRHLIDYNYGAWLEDRATTTNYKLKEPCKVYALDFERELSPQPVQSYPTTEYPYFDVETTDLNYKFTAQPFFVPSAGDGLSEEEETNLDIALLRVVKSNDSIFSHKSYGSGYGFPFSPISLLYFSGLKDPNQINQEVVVPGFAFQQLGVGAFETLRLLPITGKIIRILGGNQKFKNKPLAFEFWYFPDAFGGRSGSPIFWNGYVIGVIQTKSENMYANSVQPTIYSFISLLKEKGLLNVIKEIY